MDQHSHRSARPEAPPIDLAATRAPAPGAPQAPEPAPVDAPAANRRPLWRQFPLIAVAAIVLALLVKSFLLQAFYIPSESMLPTLEKGDRVLVEKVGRQFGGPARGEVVVFEQDTGTGTPEEDESGSPISALGNALRGLLGLPAAGKEDLIKRVIAVEGDTVEGRGDHVTLNGKPLEEDYLFDDVATYNFPELTVPRGMIFVMGDNRNGSQDSRIFGPVPVDRVVGTAVFLIWPLDRAGPL